MKRTRISTLFAVCIVAMVIQAPASAETFAFEHVNVIPMTEETVLRDQTVVVRDGVIDRIGPSAEVKIPRRARKIDGAGRYLIPGLSDLHAHFFGGKDAYQDLLNLYVAGGVTSILNMRGARGILEMREMVAAGEFTGPTVYSCSPILGNTSPTPETREKGIALVDEFAEKGYDFIKVYNFIPKEGYEGIIEAAARHDIPVVGHAVRSVGIEGAIANGQHIAHMEEMIYGYFEDDLDESKILPLAQRLREANISVVATLVTYHNIIRQVEDIDAMLASPGIEYLPIRLTRQWEPERNPYLEGFNQESVDNILQPAFDFLQKLAKGFQDAGVQLLTGTDSCIPIVVPGFASHDELREFVDAGLTPFEALTASTISAARFLGVEEQFGTVEEGKQADIVLLRANPLEAIENSKSIEGVMLHGDWHDRAALDDTLEDMRVRNQHE